MKISSSASDAERDTAIQNANAHPNVPAGFLVPSDPNSPVPNNLFPNSLTGTPTRGTPTNKIVQINPNDIEKLAVQFDQQGYNMSDADWAKRFPQLAAGRQYDIGSNLTNIEGGTDPWVANAMKQAGLGNINFGQGETTQARNLGEPILAKQQRDRQYFSTLLQDNPQRNFGLNSSDIANIAEANTGAANSAAISGFQSRLNNYQSQLNQQIQNNAALFAGIGKIGGAVINNPTLDSYLFPSGYGNTISPSAAASIGTEVPMIDETTNA